MIFQVLRLSNKYPTKLVDSNVVRAQNSKRWIAEQRYCEKWKGHKTMSQILPQEGFTKQWNKSESGSFTNTLRTNISLSNILQNCHLDDDHRSMICKFYLRGKVIDELIATYLWVLANSEEKKQS